jgi:hypothetical protein
MGIDPHFNLWNHFFLIWLPRGSGAEAVVLGVVDIHVNSGYYVDPYFNLPMPRFVNGWWKMWFFLGNGTDMPLPVLTVNSPIPQPNWEDGVAKKDHRKLQPLRKVDQ